MTRGECLSTQLLWGPSKKTKRHYGEGVPCRAVLYHRPNQRQQYRLLFILVDYVLGMAQAVQYRPPRAGVPVCIHPTRIRLMHHNKKIAKSTVRNFQYRPQCDVFGGSNRHGAHGHGQKAKQRDHGKHQGANTSTHLPLILHPR